MNYVRLTTMILSDLCVLTFMANSASAAIPFLSHRGRGAIQSIDEQSRWMTVADARKGSQVFAWNPSTKFSKHTKRFGRPKSISAADLKPGEQVKVLYKHQGYPTIAQKVVVTHAAPVTMSRGASTQMES
jgi:hypothetical protein